MKRRTLIAQAVCLTCLGPAFSTPLQAALSLSKDVDVIVVGAGAAGLAAALSAAENGAKVVLLEKADFIGGDSLVSGGYMNAPGSQPQKDKGIVDSADLFYEHIMASGQGLNSPELARVMADNALETFHWLTKNGVHFENNVYQIYGSGFQRTLRASAPQGKGYIEALSDACLARGVEIRTSCAVKDLVKDQESGRITGVRYAVGNSSELLQLSCNRGVVLAAGGFGANREMLSRWAPAVKDFPTDTGKGSTGEVLEAAMRVGAQTTNLNIVECIPEGAATHDQSVRLYVVMEGLLFVNKKGERFIDEAAGRDALGKALIEQGPENCFTLVDSANVAKLDRLQQKNLYRAYFAGQAWRADSLNDLADMLGIDFGNLQKSLNELPEKRRLVKPPFWAMKMHLWIHYTLGGVMIDHNAQCLDAENRPIPGLYAAGQITGNVHGANRLGGNGLTDALVFGRIAGRSCAQSDAQKPGTA